VIQIVQVAMTAGSTILPLVLSWVTRGRVRKIRLGDVEIENPSNDQVETLWAQYMASVREDDQ
jgi:hypothetical protein